jgi:hypothetical protein
LDWICRGQQEEERRKSQRIAEPGQFILYYHCLLNSEADCFGVTAPVTQYAVRTMARSPSLSLQKWDGCQHPQQTISRTGDTVDAGVFTELFGDAETDLSSGSDSPIFVPFLSTRIPSRYPRP